MEGTFLVTGAGGFLGRWVVNGLKALGVEDVVAVLRPGAPVPAEVNATRFAYADMLDGNALEELLRVVRPSTIVHFAWNATPGLYWHTRANFHWLEMTVALGRLHFQTGGQRFVFASTCAEYNWSVAGICKEGVTPTVLNSEAPTTPYALCKSLAQRALRGIAHAYGGTSASGRIFFSLGPYEHPDRLTPSVILGLLAGKRVEATHGKQVRDFLYAPDVGHAFAALACSRVEGPVNIGSGESRTLADLIGAVAGLIGRPDLVAYGAKQVAPSEPLVLVPDITRLRDEVAWRPQRTFDDAVKETVAWWLASPI